MDRVPAVVAMIDEMNEIIPGVPATEKNLKTLLERAAADGYSHFAAVTAGAHIDDLEVKPLE